MSNNTIGKSIKRLDALGKVTGQTLYPGDRSHENELWLKVLFARRPHARVISIDTSEAEALPGVMGVLTAKDVPVNQYGLQIPDQPVLCGPESNKKGGDMIRFVGDQVALIIAESEKRGMKPFLPPAVAFGSKQWPTLITPGSGPTSLAELP